VEVDSLWRDDIALAAVEVLLILREGIAGRGVQRLRSGVQLSSTLTGARGAVLVT